MKPAVELLAEARAARPHVRYTTNRRENAIAAWQDGRWVCVATLTLLGVWVGVEREVLVNGEPAWAQDEWLPEDESPESAAPARERWPFESAWSNARRDLISLIAFRSFR